MNKVDTSCISENDFEEEEKKFDAELDAEISIEDVEDSENAEDAEEAE